MGGHKVIERRRRRESYLPDIQETLRDKGLDTDYHI